MFQWAQRPGGVILPVVLVLLASCSSFTRLDREMDETRSLFREVAGEVTAPGLRQGPVALAFVEPAPSENLLGMWALNRPGSFDLVAERTPFRIVAFLDNDHDFRWRPDEPFGWYANGAAVPPDDPASPIKIVIPPLGSTSAPPPRFLGASNGTGTDAIGRVSFHHGTITPLSDPQFDPSRSHESLWKPLTFLRRGGIGIHFLTPFDPTKTPVLFVHGSGGTPRDFAPLIERLDKSRYQAWVFNYPSSLSLELVGDTLVDSLALIHHEKRLDRLVLVAHSVGGLVARHALNQCFARKGCGYVERHITISTPWEGHTSAGVATRWAPTIPPSWIDIAPGSSFLTSLFKKPLPIPHALLFSYRRARALGRVNSDGVVSLSSELSPTAQEEATYLRGINATHIGILESEETAEIVNRLLMGNTETKP